MVLPIMVGNDVGEEAYKPARQLELCPGKLC